LVKDNTIKGSSKDQVVIGTLVINKIPYFTYSTSIAINVNASPDIDYCHNDLDLTYIGTNFELNCDNSKLSVTKYHKHNQALRIGAQVNNASVIGIQDRQSNEWLKGYATQDAILFNSQPQLSRFTIEKGKITYPLFPEIIQVPIVNTVGDWFKKDPDNSTSNGCVKSSNFASSEGSPFERDVIDGVATNYLNDVYTWEADRALVKKAINKNYDVPIDGLEVSGITNRSKYLYI
jgi:hypothetical protein